jgi:hypothetical protein
MKTSIPAEGEDTFQDCFTEYEDTLIFWFNTENESTRCVTVELEQV